MERINLPDGSFLELPSNLPPSEREQIAADVQRDFGVDINDVSLLDRITDFPKSVARGTASLLTDVPLGISALVTGTQSGPTQGLQGFQDYLRTESVLASDPKLRDTFTTKLAEGAGSFVPFLGAGAAGFRLAQKGIVGPLTGQLGVPAAIAVPTGIAQQADRIDMARAGGEDVGAVTEKLSLLMGGAIGTTEVLPVASLFRRIPKNVLKYPGVADRLKSAAITGAAEGGQEVFASIAQDLVARGFYSDELPIGESLFEEFTIGGIIGGTADLVVNSMNRRSVAVESLKSMEENARANATKNLSDEKFRRAQEAGVIREFQEQPVVNIPTIPLPENLSDAPDLQVIQNADETFSVVDVNNVEQPVLQVFQEEGKAVGFKNKTESNFERKRLATEVANANFDLGLQDSATAQVFGSTVLDPNNTEINIQTLLNFDPTLKDEQRTELQKEKSTLFVGDKTYAEMIANRSDRLPLITKYLTDKGLPLRSSFTLTEAKNVLKNREFNNLTKSLSELAFQQNEDAGQQSLRDGEKIDTSVKAYKDLAETKNIDLDFNDPAVQFASERWTGFKDIRKTRSKGARELFLARLQSIPDFSVKTKFPDYRPRTYTPQDLQNFVNAARNRNFEFTKDDIAILNPPFLQGSKESAEQFFNDLVNSQRAIPTADGKFTINPNYEFDIARKAEGFAETPQEFGDRLRQEGKLPEDIIEALVAKEEVRQEGLIPPKPLEEKFIDFAEAVSEGRVNKFAKEAKAILNKRGLRETGVIISDDILSTTTITRDPQTRETLFDPTDVREKGVRGEYDKNTDIIFISLNAINPDGNLSDAEISKRIKGILDHEMIHALRFKDLITEAEYQFLTKETKRRKVPEAVDKRAFDAGETFYTRAVRNYKSMAEDPRYGLGPEAREEFYVEEAIAELFRHRDVVPTAPKKVDGIFNKIVQFFKDLGTAFRQSGFSKASEVFSALETGRVGGRARGEIRTLMYSDQLPIGARAEQTAVEIPDDRTQEEIDNDPQETGNTVVVEGQNYISTPVVSDTDPITGIVVEPMTPMGKLLNIDDLSTEQLQIMRRQIASGISELPTVAGYAEEGYNVKKSTDVLDFMIRTVPSKDYQTIAKRLKDQISKIEETTKTDMLFAIADKRNSQLIETRSTSMNWRGVSHYPFNSLITGKESQIVYIKDTQSTRTPDGLRTSSGMNYEVMLHEFVHQATQAYAPTYMGASFRGNEAQSKRRKVLINELEEIRGLLKEHITELRSKGERVPFYAEYATKNIQELLAVSLTHRGTQKVLEEIQFKRTKKSLWNKFVSALRKLLGIPARVNTAFSEFLENAAQITDLAKGDIKTAFSTSFEGMRPLSTPPAFNIAADSSIPVNERISRLEERLFRLEREQQEEGATMTTDSLNRLQGRINQTRREIEFLSNQAEETEPSEITEQIPLFTLQRGKRNSATPNTTESIQLQEAVDKAEEITKTMANGEIPPYNLNASDVALKAAIDFNEDPTAPEPPDDIPKFSAGTIPESYQDTANRIDANYTAPTKSFGARMIDLVKDPITEIRPFFNQFRTQIIDKYDPIAKKLIKGGQENEDVRIANNDATTSAIVAIRMADRARGIFQGLLNVGYVRDTIQGEEALSNVVDLPISTRFNPFLEGDQNTGGLVQIFMPLYSDPTIDKERIFKMYATLKRVKNLQENGREVEVPATPQDLEQIENIEKDFPEVVEAYDNYQNWNNRLIDFAQAKGILDQQQAETWKKHSSYYPFYRVMVDESLGGPRIAAGVLPNNPLSIELKGSEDPLQIGPVEAISRNSLSILTAALKNDGVGKLVRDLEAMDSAREITDRAQLTGKDVISYFEDGTKKYIELDDTDVFHAIRGIGGVSTDFVTNALGFPARILRDTVTRDPGFVVVNLLRDTLSAAVTSGAPLGIGGEKFTPIIDTVQNMFGDMKELERFGVLGGYDFQNDEGSVKTFVDRAMREKGLNPDNSMSPQNLFFKVWDGLGALTTKSDGATRLAVYESVYNKMKKDGASEAQAQSEAAFQALEIINFGRRGLSPAFRIITSAIPFLNARIQGLDVLWRAGSGQYSAIEKLEDGQSPKELQRKIQKAMLMRGGALIGLTAMYYALVSDTDEYKNLRREVRDDNWIIPLGDGIPAIKIPIPFEVGMLFKAIPERLFDVAMGEDALSRQAINEAIVSIKRQLGTSANLPFFEPAFGIQALKPIAEVYNNRNTFTNTEIIPYYQTKLEPGLQQRASTNELARQLGEAFNISPIKIEYIARGYTGTLGGYVLDIIDSVTRGVTGTPLIPPDIRSVPVLNRLLIDLDRSGGLQQQFYELRNEVDTVVQTMNRLRKDRRFDELSAYRTNNQGVMNVKSQIRAIDRYLEGWRKRRDTLLRRDDLSPFARRNALEELELERDKRLAIVPELRKNANVPISQVGTF